MSQEIVPPSIYQGLKSVKNLKRERSKAREGKPVLPVPKTAIDAVVPLLATPVRAMIQLQLLTGMCPGEVLKMKARDVDTTGEIWIYRPENHKNAWRGKARNILIGPRGQDALLPFLVGRFADEFVFNPHDGRSEFIDSNYRDDAKASVRGMNDGEYKPYTIHGYTSSIQKACKKAGVEKWSPGRLRHNAATNINREFGDIDASRVYLGHSEKSTTQIYAERDLSRATEIAKRIG